MARPHTPGEWRVKRIDYPRGQVSFEVLAGKDLIVQTVMREIGDGWRNDIITDDEANVRLIAAAPQLLAALKALLADCEEYSRINNLHNEDGSPATNHAMRMASEAIAKATQS